MANASIWKRRNELEKARRDYMREVMEEYDKEYNSKMAELRKLCDHSFRYSHIGPIGRTWFYCSHCGQSKVEEP